MTNQEFTKFIGLEADYELDDFYFDGEEASVRFHIKGTFLLLMHTTWIFAANLVAEGLANAVAMGIKLL